ncbi:tyrosine-type recombinase/integrase [Tenacibaculum geojense]|uniref:Tyrosine-type recombinase/integrase n=1 Tax=Tenacibaculum geojense TaxID=915352 RepID=A0ABW3JT52_9FLAO
MVLARISIVLDTRRKKLNGVYPVKVRVYHKATQKTRLYSLGIDLNKDDFEDIWKKRDSVRGRKKKIRRLFQEAENRANDLIDEMDVFDFDIFEMKYFRKSTDKNSVKYHFERIIQGKKELNKINTADSYKYTIASLKEYSEEYAKNNVGIEKLTFNHITVDWLKGYEKSMLERGKSINSVGIYLRTLKAVFGYAVDCKDISEDIIPFGSAKKGKYQIPKETKVKKALTSLQLKTFFDAEVLNDSEQEAKDFWFFSYFSNGMNFKDILLLKHSDLDSEKFSYYRAKTIDRLAEKQAINVYLNDFTKQVISKYANKNKNGYLFNIVSLKDDVNESHKKVKNFTRKVNTYIKRIAKRNGLPNDISTYWARHSFATNSIRKGASMEFMMETLNHSSLDVTKKYFAGFEDETKKEFAKRLLDF